ncbi:MAG: CD225/dispanin family protein [Acutalibacteraceae bacterium]
MKCQNCQHDILPSDKFCPYCGVDVKQESEAAQQQEQNGSFVNTTAQSTQQKAETQAANEQAAPQTPPVQTPPVQTPPVQNPYVQSNNTNPYQQPQQNPYQQPQYQNNQYGQPVQNPYAGNVNQPVPPYGQKYISNVPYLIFAIISCLCCFFTCGLSLALSIPSIVYAVKIKNLQDIGDYEGAKSAARVCLILFIIAFAVGIIFTVLGTVLNISIFENGTSYSHSYPYSYYYN